MSIHGVRRVSVILLQVLILLGSTCKGSAAESKSAVDRPREQESFTDSLNFHDTERWVKANGWINGVPFDNAWDADHVMFTDSGMILRVDNATLLGKAYSAGEYRTLDYYGYGCYEAWLRPVSRAGIVTSFFTYAGALDKGGNGRHNEIDIEFLGNDTRFVHFNFWTNDDDYSSRNEYAHRLDFDASLDVHAYGFKWSAKGIQWYVDGKKVHEVVGDRSHPTPRASDSLQKIMMNVWPVDATASDWAGVFVYPGYPLDAIYRQIRFTKGEHCEMLTPVAPEDSRP